MFATPSSRHALEHGAALTPKFNADGLIPVIAQEADSGKVLMLAYMNAEALARTLETGAVHYWSRSRQELWRKGETSGHVQELVEIRIDCDQDALLVRVKQTGTCCHVGYPNCFYRIVEHDAPVSADQTPLRIDD